MNDNAWVVSVLSDLEKASLKEGLTRTAAFLRMAQGAAIAEVMWNAENEIVNNEFCNAHATDIMIAERRN